MKLKMTAVALFLSAAMCCSESQATDLLGRMLNRGGCGGCASSCCDTPAPACGGHSFGFSLNISFGVNGGLFNRGCGGGGLFAGCGQNAGCDTCGQTSCGGGCGLRGPGLLSGIFSGRACNTGCDSGCGAPTMVNDDCGCTGGRVKLFSGRCGVADCGGCNTGCGGGLLSSLRGRFASMGSCGGCDTGCAPAPNMGCGTCDTGCNSGCGLLSGLRGRLAGLRGRLGCGCGSATCGGGCEAPANNCGGCEADPCARPTPVRNILGGVRARLSAIGSCNNGCDTGCNNGCDTGYVGGNSGCGCSSTTVAPMNNNLTMNNLTPMQAQPQMVPATPAPTQSVEPTPAQGSTSSINPTVDPSAFIIRGSTRH